MSKISLVISVYGKIHELELILTALGHQSFRDFEVIIADDGSGNEMKNFIEAEKKKSKLKINHIWQEDKGFRKNRILNKAVTAAKAPQLVFIDGDCLPHSDFIMQHYKNYTSGYVLCGSRVNMSKRLSKMITIDAIRSKEYQKGMLGKIIDSFRDKDKRSTYIEEGFYIESDLIHKIIRRNKPRLLGCNFSVSKEMLIKINGFDENYTGPGVGEDSDIEFRLKHAGAHLKSVRNKAIVYHFYHPVTKESPSNYKYFQSVKLSKEYISKNGIKKL